MGADLDADNESTQDSAVSSGKLLEALHGRIPIFSAGEVWLVGAGPGDPGLLTVNALGALLQADVIVYDALVDARVLALARPDVQLRFAGKRGGRPSISQEDISAQLISLAGRGLRVLRLKGGDPFVFGRGAEEILALARARVTFRIVPGVTAGLGGSAAAWIPATMRGVNQAVILATGHSPEDEHSLDWSALARTRQPIIIYMGLRNIESIASALMGGGLPVDTPVAVIASATLPQERVIVSSLATIGADARAADLEAPAVIVVGHIVRTRQWLLEAFSQAQSPIASNASDPSVAAP